MAVTRTATVAARYIRVERRRSILNIILNCLAGPTMNIVLSRLKHILKRILVLPANKPEISKAVEDSEKARIRTNNHSTEKAQHHADSHARKEATQTRFQ